MIGRMAFITNNVFPPREGIGRHILEIATRLQARGHECLVLCPGPAKNGWQRQSHRGLSLLRYPYLRLRPFHNTLLRPLLQRWIDDGAEGASMLHLHLPLLPPLQSACPQIVTFHSPMLNDTAAIREAGWRTRLIKANAQLFAARYEQAHIDNAHRLIAVSRGVAGELASTYRLGDRQVEVITNGVDTRFFPHVAGTRRNRHLLYVGRLGYRKGLSRLLDALAMLDDPRIKLELAGEGPLEGALRAQAKRLGIAERVVFLGFLDRNRLREALKCVGCLVNPADYESGPLTLLEALAVGTPVVSTPTGLALELGSPPPLRLCDATADSLALTIMQALDETSRSRELARAGRELVERHFDWDVIVGRLVEACTSEERRAA